MADIKRDLFKLFCEKIGQNYVMKHDNDCLIGIETSFDFPCLEENIPKIHKRLAVMMNYCLQDLSLIVSVNSHIIKCNLSNENDYGIIDFSALKLMDNDYLFNFNVYLCHRGYDLVKLDLRHRFVRNNIFRGKWQVNE